MTPTPHLRFVMRQETFEIIHDGYTEVAEVRPVRILQQWWIPECQYGCTEFIDIGLPTERTIKNVNGAGEWRDVPMEEESK